MIIIHIFCSDRNCTKIKSAAHIQKSEQNNKRYESITIYFSVKSVQITNNYRFNTQYNILSILSFEPAEQATSHGDSALGKYEWSDRGRNPAQY